MDKKGKSGDSSFAVLIILLFFLALIDISALVIWKFPESFAISPTGDNNNNNEGETGTTTNSGDASPSSASVAEVLDGETLKLDNGKYVKMIGIDAPSVGQAYYDESKRALEFLTLKKVVKLEADKQDKDSSGTLLRYVYVDYNSEVLFLNYDLVRQGYAKPLPIEPNTLHKGDIQEAWLDCQSDKLRLCS
jgi:micrococcal nuclease